MGADHPWRGAARPAAPPGTWAAPSGPGPWRPPRLWEWPGKPAGELSCLRSRTFRCSASASHLRSEAPGPRSGPRTAPVLRSSSRRGSCRRFSSRDRGESGQEPVSRHPFSVLQAGAGHRPDPCPCTDCSRPCRQSCPGWTRRKWYGLRTPSRRYWRSGIAGEYGVPILPRH